MRKFLRELKHRGVYQVAAFYAAGAWALLQVADVVFPLFGLEDGWISVVLLVAAGGFPIALLLSWALDWTPTGVEVADASPVEPAIAARPLRPGELLILLLLIALVAMVAYLYWERLGPATRAELGSGFVGQVLPLQRAPAHNSIAVLPFHGFDGDPGNGYFGDGLAEEILNLLAKTGQLDVAARTSSFAFRDSDTDIRRIAGTLGVKHVLEGSVRRSGSEIRISAQLIDASTGYHVWSDAYDREFNDIFAIQDDIARKVTEVIQGILSTESATLLAGDRPTSSLEAYEHYLHALEYLRRPENASSINSAITLLNRATSLDPAFAAAQAATCRALLEFYSLRRSTEHYHAAERACFRALALEESDPEVKTALGNLYLQSGEYERAADQFNQVVAAAPDHTDAWTGLAWVRFEQGREGEAESLLREQIERRPYYWPTHRALGKVLFEAGRPAEAIQAYRVVVALTPDNHIGYNGIGSSHFMLGEYAEAAAAWQQSLALLPTALTYANTGSSYYYLGDFDNAAQMYGKAVTLAPEDYENHGALGDALLWGGKAAMAKDSYARAADMAEKSLRINPTDADTTALLAHYRAGLGQDAQARAAASRAVELAPQNMFVYYDSAIAHAILGDSALAQAAIERAIALGFPRQLAALEPGLAPLLGEVDTTITQPPE